jgi:toxin ParE1/3/4
VTPARAPWPVRLTAAAETDFRGIVQWTAERFGRAQARAYAETLSMALAALAVGPTAIGVKPRDDIAKGLFSFHVTSAGRKGRHFVIFRISGDQHPAIEVLRLLHDSMDLPRHLPPREE